MFGKSTLLLAILVAVCAAASAVIDVSQKNIRSLLKENEGRPFMVAFTAPWCGHCKSLKPVWEKLAKANEGIISYGNVNCDDEKALASKYGVKGFPTIKVFIDGKARDYSGARDAKSIQAFAAAKFKGNVKSVKDADKFTAAAEESEHAFLVIGKKKISPLLKALSVDFGDALFASVDASSTAGKDLAKKYSVSGSGPHVVYVNADNESKLFDGKVSKSTLSNFIGSSLGLEEAAEATPEAEAPKPKTVKTTPTKKAVKVHAGNFVESCVSSGKACIVVAAGEVNESLADKLAERFSREKKIRVVSVDFEGNPEFFAVLGVKAAGEVAVVKGTNKSQTTAPFSVKYHSGDLDGFSPAVVAISKVLGGDMRYSRTSELPLPAEK